MRELFHTRLLKTKKLAFLVVVFLFAFKWDSLPLLEGSPAKQESILPLKDQQPGFRGQKDMQPFQITFSTEIKGHYGTAFLRHLGLSVISRLDLLLLLETSLFLRPFQKESMPFFIH